MEEKLKLLVPRKFQEPLVFEGSEEQLAKIAQRFMGNTNEPILEAKEPTHSKRADAAFPSTSQIVKAFRDNPELAKAKARDVLESIIGRKREATIPPKFFASVTRARQKFEKSSR